MTSNIKEIFNILNQMNSEINSTINYIKAKKRETSSELNKLKNQTIPELKRVCDILFYQINKNQEDEDIFDLKKKVDNIINEILFILNKDGINLVELENKNNEIKELETTFNLH